jgi:hypothetical protein
MRPRLLYNLNNLIQVECIIYQKLKKNINIEEHVKLTINIDQLRKISKRKHLKDYDLKQIFIDIGLYQDILIDCYSENVQLNEVCDDITLDELMVSDDIERFNECWNSSQPIILHCPKCGEDRPFILHKAYKPHCNEENVIARKNSLYRLGENYLTIIDTVIQMILGVNVA